MKRRYTITKAISVTLCLILCLGILASCGKSKSDDMMGGEDNATKGDKTDINNSYNEDMEQAPEIDGLLPNKGPNKIPTDDSFADMPSEGFSENPFISTKDNPISTFSADVDTASYTYFRKLISKGYSSKELSSQFQSAPLRTEEMVNYFKYSYATPSGDNIFGTHVSVSPTPWNDESYLMTLGISTSPAIEKAENNLVFLIDVSGSMSTSDKLPLLKTAFHYLTAALDENDTVSIVTYSGKEAVVLSGCSGDKKDEILSAINSLSASGATNGEAGLTMAYSLAQDYFKESGNNRIILASDGDLNVGISSAEELEKYVSEKRDSGIFLSVLGFGTGNYKDSTMSALAENGNGVYYYIDGENEAKKVLGTDLLSTLYTVAKDVKFQLNFDPERVAKYRLIGYESRILDTEDFENDFKDAGDVGAGHCVTVCFELILNDKEGDEAHGLASLRIRYKEPTATQSTERDYIITDAVMTDTPTDEQKFICAVIETAMILNGSQYNKKNITLSQVADTLSSLDLGDDEYKLEFRELINIIK